MGQRTQSRAAEAPDDMTWDQQTRDWLRQVLKPEFEARGDLPQ